MMRVICFMMLVALLACNQPKEEYRLRIALKGVWGFALDTANVGAGEQWYLRQFADSVQLPGTTDLNRKGHLNLDTTAMHLNRVYTYEGAAWYRKKVTVPASFADKHIGLFFERSKSTQVWVDGQLVGGSKLLQSPQQFDVTDYLQPGEHEICVLVNNDLKLTPYGNVHIYSDDTQTNWNGILGEMYLEASAKTYITNLQVYPNVKKNLFEVELSVNNELNRDSLDVELRLSVNIDGKSTALTPLQTSTPYKDKMRVVYRFDTPCALWDEYKQPVYELKAMVGGNGTKDAQTVRFGMREFAAVGTQFAINGRTTFLRGKHEAAVFPLTGFPPMDTAEWTRVFRIAKSYGINHYRFHTYCPPKAAFEAADRVGIYLQAELPFWGGFDSDTVAQILKQEGQGMMRAYANHPSFVMFSAGNEIWSGHDRVEQMMLALKGFDSRPLYTMGSNNGIGYEKPRGYCDFFVGARQPEYGDSVLGHARLTHAYCDAVEGGILNTQTPATDHAFDFAVAHVPIPLVSHEIGQYQIYPDYREIAKYTGVLQARNLEVFKQGLQKAGMAHLDTVFRKATGAWSALCYKAEMEAALRTQGMAGFQLLDLQDFPGQGTALVGILDAFMDSKGVIGTQAWKQSCNDVVLLLEFAKYCWTNEEVFKAKVLVANYSDKAIDGVTAWVIKTEDGRIVGEGSFAKGSIQNGGLMAVGEISVPLSSFSKTTRLHVELEIPNTAYANTYPIWVYPSNQKIIDNEAVTVSEELDATTLEKLKQGASVLLLPQTKDVKGNSIAGHFPPEFWNYGMFKGISEWAKKPVSPGTLGLLMDPQHPVFASFPTDSYTNWQWFAMVKASNSLILDSIGHDYYPIVQVVDNLERNHKLGMLMEFKVGAGRLFVCMALLNKLKDKPEAVQLYRSILNYMHTEDFNPSYELTEQRLTGLFRP